MDKIEQDIIRASQALGVSGDEVTFIGRDGRIYRPILARHKLYYDGSRKFYVLFVETISRRALVAAFGFDKRAGVERFYADWEAEKTKLYAVLPGTNEQIEAATRDHVKNEVIRFLGLVRAQNADFLQLCIEAYSSEMLGELSREKTADHSPPGGEAR